MRPKKKQSNITVFNDNRSQGIFDAFLESGHDNDESNENETNNEEDNMDIAESYECTTNTTIAHAAVASTHERNEPHCIEHATTIPCSAKLTPNQRKKRNLKIRKAEYKLITHSIEPVTTIPPSTPLSSSQQKNRNRKIRKAQEQVRNQEDDKVLRSLAFQNTVDNELPFPPIPHDRQPKRIIEKPIVFGPHNWVLPEKLLHAPRKSSKPSEHAPRKSSKPSEPPKQKKVTLPAIDYVIVPNCDNVAKPNNILPSYPLDDDDDDDDDDYDDYYDGVAEHRTTSPNSTIDNAHKQTMLPHEIAATHAIKAQIIAKRRRVTPSMKREFRNKQLKQDRFTSVDEGEFNMDVSSDTDADTENESHSDTESENDNVKFLHHEMAAKVWCEAEKIDYPIYIRKKMDQLEKSRKRKKKYRYKKNIAEAKDLKREYNTNLQKNLRCTIINEHRNDIKPYCSGLQCNWNSECRWGCGYIHLDRATKHMKSNCCQNGLLSPMEGGYYFKRYGDLKPMSPEMQDLMINNIEHMGPLSSTYGNVLSLAAIGVENGHKATGVKNTHPGGFENRCSGAPSCVTMYGRTFHYLTVASDLADGIGKIFINSSVYNKVYHKNYL